MRAISALLRLSFLDELHRNVISPTSRSWRVLPPGGEWFEHVVTSEDLSAALNGKRLAETCGSRGRRTPSPRRGRRSRRS